MCRGPSSFSTVIATPEPGIMEPDKVQYDRVCKPAPGNVCLWNSVSYIACLFPALILSFKKQEQELGQSQGWLCHK